MTVFTSLGVALLFAAIFLFGGRVAYRPGQRGRRRFLSFAAGISVAYTLCTCCHAPGEMQGDRDELPGTTSHRVFRNTASTCGPWPGFLVFLRHRGPGDPAAKRRRRTARATTTVRRPGGRGSHRRLRHVYLDPDVHDGVDGERRSTLCLFAVAMGMHIFTITCNLQPLPRGLRPSWRLPAGGGLPGGLGVAPKPRHPQAHHCGLWWPSCAAA